MLRRVCVLVLALAASPAMALAADDSTEGGTPSPAFARPTIRSHEYTLADRFQ